MPSNFSYRFQSAALVGVMILAIQLTGCGIMPTIEDNHLEKPKLDFFEYFSGKATGSGFIRNWRGQVVDQFTVVMEGEYLNAEKTQLRIDESFVFNNGKAQKRIWTLEKTSNGRFVGTAEDTIGQAQGREMGNAVNWRYQLIIPYRGRELKITFDDWMYLQSDGRLLNAVTMKKFGLPVGSLFIAFDQVGSSAESD